MKQPKADSLFTLPRLMRAALTAALYVGLTLLFSQLSFGMVQFRISEALCVLPFFFPETVFGLFFGCVISNFFSPFILPLDIVLGSTATFLAAYLTSRCKLKWIAPLSPVLCNAIIVPFIFYFTAPENGFWATYFPGMFFVAVGEIAVCYGLGMPLILALERLPLRFSKQGEQK